MYIYKCHKCVRVYVCICRCVLYVCLFFSWLNVKLNALHFQPVLFFLLLHRVSSFFLIFILQYCFVKCSYYCIALCRHFESSHLLVNIGLYIKMLLHILKRSSWSHLHLRIHFYYYFFGYCKILFACFLNMFFFYFLGFLCGLNLNACNEFSFKFYDFVFSFSFLYAIFLSFLN